VEDFRMRKVLALVLAAAMVLTLATVATANNGVKLVSEKNEWFVVADEAGTVTVKDNKVTFTFEVEAGKNFIGLQKGFTGQLKFVGFEAAPVVDLFGDECADDCDCLICAANNVRAPYCWDGYATGYDKWATECVEDYRVLTNGDVWWATHDHFDVYCAICDYMWNVSVLRVAEDAECADDCDCCEGDLAGADDDNEDEIIETVVDLSKCGKCGKSVNQNGNSNSNGCSYNAARGVWNCQS